MAIQKPQIPQMLHVGRARLFVQDSPELNLSPRDLGADEQFQLSFTGSPTLASDTPTIVVMSRLLKVQAQIVVPVIRTTDARTEWQARVLKNSYLGSISFVTDSTSEKAYDLVNCAITSLPSYNTGGSNPSASYTITGTLYINEDEWEFSS